MSSVTASSAASHDSLKASEDAHYKTLHDLVHAFNATRGPLPAAILNFAAKHLPPLLADPSNPFAAPVKGVSIDKSEQQTVDKLAAHFHGIDKTRACVLLRSYNKSHGLSTADKFENMLDDLTVHYFQERAALLEIVAYILRTTNEDVDSATFQVFRQLLSPLLVPSAPQDLLKAFTHRATSPLPQNISANPLHATFHSKQLVAEQKLLLEIVFLFYYDRIVPDGKAILCALDVIAQTDWGSKQINEGHFDGSTKAQAIELQHLLLVIAIEVLNLEKAFDHAVFGLPTPDSPQLPPNDDLLNPATLVTVHSKLMDLASSPAPGAAALLYSWAFILSRITDTFTTYGIVPEYDTFAGDLLPSSPNSQPLYQLIVSHTLSADPSQSVFSLLSSVLKSSLLWPSQSPHLTHASTIAPNIPGYLSVLRALLVSLPKMLHPSFLDDAQFSHLLEAFEALYSNPAAGLLRAQFWGLLGGPEEMDTSTDLVVAAEKEPTSEEIVLEAARARFPARLRGFIRLVRATSGSLFVPATGSSDAQDEDEVDEDAELAVSCAAAAYRYLTSLSTCTFALPEISAASPLPFDISETMDTAQYIRLTRNIRISPSFDLLAGHTGKIVSNPSARPTVLSVSTPEGWSCWRLFGDLLREHANSITGKVEIQRRNRRNQSQQIAEQVVEAISVASETVDEREQDVLAILELTATVLAQLPDASIDIVRELSAGSSSHDDGIIESFFQLLEAAFTSLPSSQTSSHIASAVIAILSSLLPSYTGQIWTLLKGTSQLFRPTSTIASSRTWGSRPTPSISYLSVERSKGCYEITLSVLHLVHSLILEVQRSASSLIDEYFAQMKAEVLHGGIAWMLDEVWVTFTNWKYIDLDEKHEISVQCVRNLELLLGEALCDKSNSKPAVLAKSVDLVLDAFFRKASAAVIMPPLNIIATSGDMIAILNRSGSHNNATRAEAALQAQLALIYDLLLLRPSVLKNSQSLLEESLFASSTSHTLDSSVSRKSTLGPVQCLLNYVTSAFAINTSICSAQILALLSHLSVDHRDKTYLASRMGSQAEIDNDIAALLAIASDPFMDVGLQSAIWSLMASITSSQPGLASFFVLGRSFAMSAPEAKDRRNAVDVAFEVLKTWEDIWDLTPALLVTCLRFLTVVWSQLAEYGPHLAKYRSKETPWADISKLAMADSGPAAPESSTILDGVLMDITEASAMATKYSFKTEAKAYAVQLLALDVQYAIRSSDKAKPIPTTPSLTVVTNIFKSRTQTISALSSAILNLADPELQHKHHVALKMSFPGFQLDNLAKSSAGEPFASGRIFGANYLYPIDLVHRRLQGFLGTDQNLDPDTIQEAVEKIIALNLNWSLIDSQIKATRAWRLLLEVTLPALAGVKEACDTISGVLRVIAADVAGEQRSGAVMEVIHQERLAILTALVEMTVKTKTLLKAEDLAGLMEEAQRILTNDKLDPLQSLAYNDDGADSKFHRTAFKAVFFIFRKAQLDLASVTLDHKQKLIYNSALETSFKISIQALQRTLIKARSVTSPAVEEDMSLAVSLFVQTLSLPNGPKEVVWLALAHEIDLFRTCFEVYVQMAHLSNGPIYSPHLATLFLAIAATPAGAERLAVEGLLSAINNNALSGLAESGNIQPVSASTPPERNSLHSLWCAQLALVTRLVICLGDHASFLENEVYGFLQLYHSQLDNALRWTTTYSLTLAHLEEMRNTLALLFAVVSKTSSSSRSEELNSSRIQTTLLFIQQIMYLLQHPNHLSALLEPLTVEEKSWMEADVATSAPSDDVAALLKRPVVASVVQDLLGMLCSTMQSLLAYTQAIRVISREGIDWPQNRVLLSPTEKVVLSEPATIGTLIDLSRFCLDLIRISPSACIKNPPTSPLKPFDLAEAQALGQHTLELVLTLASTQLALWLNSSEARLDARKYRDAVELAQDVDAEIGKAETFHGRESRLWKLLKKVVEVDDE